MTPRYLAFLLPSALTLVVAQLPGCGGSSRQPSNPDGADPNDDGGKDGGSDAASDVQGTTTGIAASCLNQCGVGAPQPADDGRCGTVSAATITNFDDFAGGAAASYTYQVGTAGGAILHIGDGSDANGGTSVISTDMVAGEGNTGYALQISNTRANNWGGVLMMYFPGSVSCLDARAFSGIELSVKGTAPSGNIAVSLGMLDTVPPADGGLCSNASSSDCKNATIQLALPSDPQAWTKVQIPWSALTPGIGSNLACVPVNGKNFFRLFIQPLMSYPPPSYTFQPGPYSIAVDNIRFYGPTDTSSPADACATTRIGGASCGLAATLKWNTTAPVISPVSDATHKLTAVKDPTVVRYNDRWHVYASSVSTAGAYGLVYASFSDWSEAPTAPLYYMDQTPGFNTYVAAPELFYFTPQKKWYLVFQSGPPMYSTADDPGAPATWTRPAPFFADTPATVKQNGGGWLDFWVICDTTNCHLFFSDNHGRWYRSQTTLGQFPNGFGEPVVVLQDSNAGRVFEASNVYRINRTNQYLALIEAFDQTSNSHRYFRSWIADRLEGPWVPWQASGSFPFAGASNVTFAGSPWTIDISHGDMIRAGYDETLAIDPCNMRYVYQGADPTADTGGDYNKIPWNIGLLTQAP